MVTLNLYNEILSKYKLVRSQRPQGHRALRVTDNMEWTLIVEENQKHQIFTISMTQEQRKAHLCQ